MFTRHEARRELTLPKPVSGERLKEAVKQVTGEEKFLLDPTLATAEHLLCKIGQRSDDPAEDLILLHVTGVSEIDLFSDKRNYTCLAVRHTRHHGDKRSTLMSPERCMEVVQRFSERLMAELFPAAAE